MASNPTAKPTPTTPPVVYAQPAGLEIECPKCHAMNTSLRGGVVIGRIMRVPTERGLRYECSQCATSWPAE